MAAFLICFNIQLLVFDVVTRLNPKFNCLKIVPFIVPVPRKKIKEGKKLLKKILWLVVLEPRTCNTNLCMVIFQSVKLVKTWLPKPIKRSAVVSLYTTYFGDLHCFPDSYTYSTYKCNRFLFIRLRIQNVMLYSVAKRSFYLHRNKSSSLILIILLGVIHKWRHAFLDNFWHPLPPSSRILVLRL